MYTGFYTAVAGSVAQEKRLAVLTNNLANVSTVGFKSDTPVFHARLTQAVVAEVQLPDSPQPVVTSVDPLMNLHTPQHPQVTAHTDFSQGAIRETGNPLDMALEGNGFFTVEGPEAQMAYTRQGTFSINADGLLVTQNGLLVQGEGGPLRVADGRVEIDPTGRVLVNGTFIDRLKLVDFPSPDQLEKIGDALFRATDPDLPAETATDLVVHHRAIEQSNSPLLHLLGAVIQTSRAYEAYQRMIQIYDDTAGRAVNDIART
jgi:flagellar basal-body rod protein FlgF